MQHDTGAQCGCPPSDKRRLFRARCAGCPDRFAVVGTARGGRVDTGRPTAGQPTAVAVPVHGMPTG
jgi:hypothetical protein